VSSTQWRESAVQYYGPDKTSDK